MATKERKNKLIKLADEVIRESSICQNNVIISESYNGQIAAFSVSVALSGLKPAVALYYSGRGSSDVDKKKIIELLAAMYNRDTNSNLNVSAFFAQVIGANSNEERTLRTSIIEYAIALKLSIRTFSFQ